MTSVRRLGGNLIRITAVAAISIAGIGLGQRSCAGAGDRVRRSRRRAADRHRDQRRPNLPGSRPAPWSRPSTGSRSCPADRCPHQRAPDLPVDPAVRRRGHLQPVRLHHAVDHPRGVDHPGRHDHDHLDSEHLRRRPGGPDQRGRPVDEPERLPPTGQVVVRNANGAVLQTMGLTAGPGTGQSFAYFRWTPTQAGHLLLPGDLQRRQQRDDVGVPAGHDHRRHPAATRSRWPRPAP